MFVLTSKDEDWLSVNLYSWYGQILMRFVHNGQEAI